MPRAPSTPSQAHQPPRGGFTIVYVLVCFTMLVGFVSLSVDWGRAQLTKTQLQAAADAAARFAVKGLADNSAASKAIAVAAQNTADGSPVVLQNGDVEIGVWDSGLRRFTASANGPNAVRVTALRTAARGNPMKTAFASLLGMPTIDCKATVVAKVTGAGLSTVINVPGQANPWLAGMPNGTTANAFDVAPAESPTLMTNLNITGGAVLNFQFSGSVSNQPGNQPFNCDGNPGWIIDDYYAGAHNGAEHGIADLWAPIVCIVGVFLDDTQPDSTPAPAALDFTAPNSRDFATLSPLLKQPFFIGDGMRADGVTPQNFVVPHGATRLYVGVMDGQQWSDNSGNETTTIAKPLVITTVK